MATIARIRMHPAVVHWRTTLALLLALGAIAAAALAWIGYTAIGTSESVVVAARAIPPGTRLTAADLAVIQVSRVRPLAWRGVPDPRMVIGAYTRVALAPDQIVQPELLQASPLGAAVFMPEKDGIPEVVQGVVFELSRQGVSAVAPRTRINIIALIDAERGADPSFSVGAMDRPGSGARAVRVLRNLRVVHVTERTALLDVTAAQSHYLWSLTAADIPFVGEVSATDDVALGPLLPAQFDVIVASAAPEAGESPSSPPIPPTDDPLAPADESPAAAPQIHLPRHPPTGME